MKKVRCRAAHCVPAIFAYASDPEISAWSLVTPWNLKAPAPACVRARWMIGSAEGGSLPIEMIGASNPALLGSCGFGRLDVDRGFGELGYVLAKPYWGLGYATEAAAAVLKFGFTQLGLSLIESNAMPENLASLRVMAKLGLRSPRPSSLPDPTTGESRPVSAWATQPRAIGRSDWNGQSTTISPPDVR